MIEPMSISCDMLSFNTYGEKEQKRRENKTFKLLLYYIGLIEKNLMILKMSTNNALHFI